MVLAADHVVRRGGGAVEGSSQALGVGEVMELVTLSLLYCNVLRYSLLFKMFLFLMV